MSASITNHKYPAEGSDHGSDDFVMLDTPSDLSTGSKVTDTANAPRIEVNALTSGNTVLVSIHPPSHPANEISHVPCDIVLVIDVSGSMATLAPLPDTEDEREQEAAGLTVLDLVRHASKTIISTLNDNDRLALVTFANEAELVQPLTRMTETAKAETVVKIDELGYHGMTNLWAGIKTGLYQFEQNAPIGNVQGLFVLTDGRPNYMCPPQGYITKLKPLLNDLGSANGSSPTIQTFGFGFSLRSDLMLSIAETGNGGNFAFIPDVGMIGTVFVHAVANLYSTYATGVSLELDATQFDAVELQHNSGLPTEQPSASRILIKLGSMIYGQSRDIIVRCAPSESPIETSVLVKLTYSTDHRTTETVELKHSFDQVSTLPLLTMAYHLMRNDLCNFLSSLYPVRTLSEHSTETIDTVDKRAADFEKLVQRLMSFPDSTTDPNLSSLLSDLIGQDFDPKRPELGQVHQALQTQKPDQTQGQHGGHHLSYWEKWGRHYLSSLWCAHMRQTCNSFKDQGPLRYGIDSAIFKRCRDQLDSMFDNLPPPKGTWRGRGHGGSFRAMRKPAGQGSLTIRDVAARRPGSPSLRMSRWNRSDNPCFLGSCPVKLAGGLTTTVDKLRSGMMIESPLSKTSRRILLVTRTSTAIGDMVCRIGSDLWLTPWHPILDRRRQGQPNWVFPHDVADETRQLSNHEPVYSIMLEPSDNPDDHAVLVGDIPCVTLGHGLQPTTTTDTDIINNKENDDDVRAHPFFSNHALLRHILETFPTDPEGRKLVSGLLRDPMTGLACSFAASRSTEVQARL